MSAPRWPRMLSRPRERALAVLGAVFLVVIVVSATIGKVDRPLRVAPPTSGSGVPESAAWFCPGVSGTAGGSFDVASTASAASSGVARLVGSAGGQRTLSITVAAGATSSIVPGSVLAEPIVAVTFEFNEGHPQVSSRFSSGDQAGLSCVQSASTSWQFVDGTTAQGAPLQMAIYNPFLDDAVIDLRFATDTGDVNPNALQGVVVPARSVATVDVGSLVTRRQWIAPSVTARRGRIVASMLQTVLGVPSSSPNSPAVRASGGVLEPSASWSMPALTVNADSGNQLSLFNPTEVEVGATVSVAADNTTIAPFVVRVPARNRVIIDLRNEPRIPRGVPLRIEVEGETDETALVAGLAANFDVNGAVSAIPFRIGTPVR